MPAFPIRRIVRAACRLCQRAAGPLFSPARGEEVEQRLLASVVKVPAAVRREDRAGVRRHIEDHFLPILAHERQLPAKGGRPKRWSPPTRGAGIAAPRAPPRPRSSGRASRRPPFRRPIRGPGTPAPRAQGASPRASRARRPAGPRRASGAKGPPEPPARAPRPESSPLPPSCARTRSRSAQSEYAARSRHDAVVHAGNVPRGVPPRPPPPPAGARSSAHGAPLEREAELEPLRDPGGAARLLVHEVTPRRRGASSSRPYVMPRASAARRMASVVGFVASYRIGSVAVMSTRNRSSASWFTLCAPARRYSRRRTVFPVLRPHAVLLQLAVFLHRVPGRDGAEMPQTSASTGSGAISMPALARGEDVGVAVRVPPPVEVEVQRHLRQQRRRLLLGRGRRTPERGPRAPLRSPSIALGRRAPAGRPEVRWASRCRLPLWASAPPDAAGGAGRRGWERPARGRRIARPRHGHGAARQRGPAPPPPRARPQSAASRARAWRSSASCCRGLCAMAVVALTRPAAVGDGFTKARSVFP